MEEDSVKRQKRMRKEKRKKEKKEEVSFLFVYRNLNECWSPVANMQIIKLREKDVDGGRTSRLQKKLNLLLHLKIIIIIERSFPSLTHTHINT